MKSLALAAILAVSAGVASAITTTFTNNERHSIWYIHENTFIGTEPVINGIPQPQQYYILRPGETITVEGNYVSFNKEGLPHLTTHGITTKDQLNSDNYEAFVTFLEPNKYQTEYSSNIYSILYKDGVAIYVDPTS